jgi:hypothetical protein
MLGGWIKNVAAGTTAEIAAGIPIGNLTSQMFANLCLDPLDHFVRDCWSASATMRGSGMPRSKTSCARGGASR